ncbi:MAG TPA: hypothetical protein VEH28_01235 [Thermoplasmata archaeon]|nr:hypothetical protein [Thermoplasmata archaeon]
MQLDPIFRGPTSVLVWGDDRSLLNWVAYALASVTDPEFHWTDVRYPDQAVSATDPLARGRIPPNRLSVVETRELAPNDASANVAVSAVIRSDEIPDNVQRVLDFLRLPTITQRVLEQTPPEGRPRVVVLSNGHRITAFYPTPDVIDPTLRAIVGANTILIMTFGDAGPGGRFRFDNVLHLEGSVRDGWRSASLMVEKWVPGGPFEKGTTHQLADLSSIADVLARELG